MTDPRVATVEDVDLVAGIGAAGFHDDPVLSWVFPDPATRAEKLAVMFHGLAVDMLEPDRGVVHLVDEVCAAMWRDPDFDHGQTAADRAQTDGDDPASDAGDGPFDAGELARMEILGEVMQANHPHAPHWYLNVISTVPERQGRGLGRAALEPVLRRCDADGTRAYLESTNPRNRTLYRRVGFVDAAEIEIPDGPSMLAMWRDPLS